MGKKKKKGWFTSVKKVFSSSNNKKEPDSDIRVRNFSSPSSSLFGNFRSFGDCDPRMGIHGITEIPSMGSPENPNSDQMSIISFEWIEFDKIRKHL